MIAMKQEGEIGEFIAELQRTHLMVADHLPARVSHILNSLKRCGLDTSIASVNFDLYQEWMRRADYERYPDYIPVEKTALLAAKSMQHYLAASLLDMKAEENYLDVASNRSIAADIYQRLYNLSRVWIQDLTFKPGIHGNCIGSDASAIPLDDESVDNMALHCAFEHFEGQSDVLFMREATRLLRPGGKLCIIPLYLSETYHILTSPFAWQRFRRFPNFGYNEKAVLFLLDDARASKYYDTMFWRRYDVERLVERVYNEVQSLCNMNIVYYENWQSIPGCPQFALYMEKVAKGQSS